MAAESPTSLQGRTREERRRACDTALRNSEAKANRRGVPIYQRRTPLTLHVTTSEEELNAAARALAALWGTTKNPRGR